MNYNLQTITVPLKVPVKARKSFGFDVAIQEVKLRRPVASDFAHISGVPTVNDYIKIVSNITGHPISVIGQIDSWDFVQIQAALTRLMTAM